MRAAELQAEAARRSEARTLPATAEDADDGPSDGYALDHVRAAAVEAGIGAEFVDAALSDLRSETVVGHRVGARPRPIAQWFLGNPPASLTARRVIDARPRDVLAAMEQLLPQEPYKLVLHDRDGDPLAGGVLEFDIPEASITPTTQTGLAMAASYADFRKVLVTLRPLADAPDRTEMTVRAPVAWAWRLNAGLCGVMAGLGTGLGFAAGIGFGAALVASGLAPAVGSAVAIGAGATSWMGSLSGIRKLHRWGLGKGEAALEGMLRAVAAQAQGGWKLVDEDPSGS